jgi:urea transport system ATP-binding protein
MKPLEHAATATEPAPRVKLKLPPTQEELAVEAAPAEATPVDDSPYPVVGQVYDFMLPRAARVPDTSHGIILYLENLSVSFDGFKAIDDLNLYVERGELRCIIGPNGAGKTTLMDIVTGKTRPDSGSAYFGRTVDLLRLTEPEIAQAGIGRKFQKPTVFEQHTVFENLELAMAGERRGWKLLAAKLSGEQRDRIDETLGIIRLADHAHRPAGALSHGQKQWLEIGMLLMQNPLLLLVDEPVAGMTHEEMDHTAELLTQLAGERSVVVVEHDMDFVRSIARKVTVLHQGSVLAEGSMDEVQNDPRVVEVYLGE